VSPFIWLRARKIHKMGIPWEVARYQAIKEAPHLNWDIINPILVGLAFICLALVLLSQLLHRFDSDNWVCSRAAYRAVPINGNLVPVTPCTEETNIETGQVRQTKWSDR
jgi:hypothetical protein